MLRVHCGGDSADLQAPCLLLFGPTVPTAPLQFIVKEEGGYGGERSVAGVDWQFNAWGGLEGGLYTSWERDQQVAGTILGMEGVRRFACPIVMEGGSIHVDGEGTLLTTGEAVVFSKLRQQRTMGMCVCVAQWKPRLLLVECRSAIHVT